MELNNKDFKKKEFYEILIFFIFVAIIIFSSIFIIRNFFFNSIMPEHQTYYNILIAKSDQNSLTGFILNDDTTIKNRKIFFEPGYFLLRNLLEIFPEDISIIASIIIFQIISIITLIILIFIIKFFTKDIITIFAIGLFLITSPQFLLLPFTLDPSVITLFIMVILTGLLIKYEYSENISKFKKNFLLIIITITTILLSITKIINYLGIISILSGLFFIIKKKDSKTKIYPFVILLSIISFLISNFSLIKTNQIMIFFNNYKFIPNMIFAEMGALHGIRIVDLFLAIIAIGLIWNKTKKYYVTSIIISSIIILSILIYDLNSIIFPVFAILSGLAYSLLSKMTWELTYIKKLCIALIIISTFISCIQYTVLFGFEEPNINQLSAVEFLSFQDLKNYTVLSSMNNGFIIENFAEMKTIIDMNLNGINYVDEHLNEYNNILNSRSLNTVKEYFIKNNIRFIIIDENMKQNIWNNKVDGIYFVIKNSDNFEMIYNKNQIEIYSFSELFS